MLKLKFDQHFDAIPRDNDVILGNEDLESLYEFNDFPVYMGCVDQAISQDVCSNMHWTISRNSGAIQLNPLLPLKIVYPEAHGSGCVGKLWMQHHSAFSSFIKSYSPRTVLEIGGAHGILSKFYHSQDPETPWTIIEPNPTPDENVNAKFIKGFFDDNFKFDDAVDAVVHSHVFEHVYYPQVFIKHISGFLDEGKYLIFSLPNMKEMLKRKYTNCVNFEHTVMLTEPYIEYLLSLNGFRILELDYFMDDHSIFYACIRDSSIVPSKLSPSLYDENKKLYQEYLGYHEKLILDLNKKIAGLSSSQKIYLFGAHVFAQYLIGFGLDTSRIVCLLDNDANKQGKRLYGTNLKVYSPKVLADCDTPVVILKAGVYNNEIKADIQSNINASTIFLD